MSRVKNILVSNIGIFKEELIRELIKNQIGYVQIENEFHFLDHIYRIYDLKLIAKLSLPFLNVNLDKLVKCIAIEEDYKLPTILNFAKVTEYVPYIEVKDNRIPKFNKQLIKQQNRQVNRIINKN